MDSIQTAVNHFLNNLDGNTKKSYSYDFKNSRTGLLVILKANHLPAESVVSQLKELHGVEWIQHLKNIGCAPATISRRISAFKNLLRFCARRYGLKLSTNLFHDTLKDEKLLRKVKNFVLVPVEKVDKIIAYCMSPFDEEKVENLLAEMRNRSIVVTLADTGLRIGEAMGLKRGSINWNQGTTVIIGKGDKRGVVRFSERSLEIIDRLKQTELRVGAKMPASISKTPLFCRYTKKGVKSLDTATGRDVVQSICMKVLGEEYIEGEITPHSLRHYFVIDILRQTGNLETAKELARHENIATTHRYTQVENSQLDAAYKAIFNRKRN